jgi:carboxypeptidase family protein
MSTTWKYVLSIILILLLGSIPLAMQRDSGAIEGVVIDDHGAEIAGATVEARNTMSGVVFPAIADASGKYKIEGLPQGRYSLWVKAAGHDSVWIREVIVDRGQRVRRDFRLAVSESPIPSGGAE